MGRRRSDTPGVYREDPNLEADDGGRARKRECFVVAPRHSSSTIKGATARDCEEQIRSVDPMCRGPEDETVDSLVTEEFPLVMLSEIQKVQVNSMIMRLKSETNNKVLIEFACSSDSQLGKVGKDCGWNVIRLTRESCDLSTIEGIAFARRAAQENPGCHLWGSIPCTAWCTYQRINESRYGSEYSLKLKRARFKSKQLLKSFIELAEYVQSRNGTVSFEWPRYCTGWKEPITERMKKILGTETVVFNGCMVGMRSKKTGLPLLKPWRVETTSPYLVKTLAQKTCDNSHQHTQITGQEGELSGYYSPELAKLIIKALDKELVWNTHTVNANDDEELYVATKEEEKKLHSIRFLRMNSSDYFK
jgi:hypothetical protein